MTEDKRQSRRLLVGIDVGSTTTKLAVVDEDTREILYSSYKRHKRRSGSERDLRLRGLAEEFPGQPMRLAMTGSGAKTIAEALHLPFVPGSSCQFTGTAGTVPPG